MTVAETVVTDLLVAGHEVTVATTDVLDERRRLPRGAEPQPKGAEVVRFANLSHRMAARLNAYSPRGLRVWLARNVSRFDIVLLQDVYSALSVMTSRAARRAGCRSRFSPWARSRRPRSEDGRWPNARSCGCGAARR